MGLTFIVCGLVPLADNSIVGGIVAYNDGAFVGVQLFCGCCLFAGGVRPLRQGRVK